MHTGTFRCYLFNLVKVFFIFLIFFVSFSQQEADQHTTSRARGREGGTSSLQVVF